MKQLITQQKIDDAASIYAKIDTNSTNQRNRYIGFKSGVRLVLNEIEPLMVEFAEWCADNHCRNLDNTWGAMDSKTTQQLLEEFINDKNTKK